MEFTNHIKDLKTTACESAPQSKCKSCSNEMNICDCHCPEIHKNSHIEVNNMVDKTFKCDVCGKEFLNKSTLALHLKVHSGETPFKCEACGKEFTYKYNLTHHLKVHTGEKQSTCEVCGKTFHRRDRYEEHQRNKCKKQDWQLLKCKICDMEFQQRKSLYKHVKTHGERPYKCDVCGKRFGQYGKFEIHQRIHTGERPYKCGECNQRFAEKHIMVIHQRIHTGERPFECDICGKCFKSRGHLTEHRKIHTHSMRFKCDICGKGFNYKSNLVQHKITHTKEKNYMCSVCGNVYRNNCTLNNHLRTHSGDRPYECDICRRRFYRSDTLEDHKKIHGEKLHVCDVCGKDFSRRDNLAAHFKRKHGRKLMSRDVKSASPVAKSCANISSTNSVTESVAPCGTTIHTKQISETSQEHSMASEFNVLDGISLQEFSDISYVASDLDHTETFAPVMTHVDEPRHTPDANCITNRLPADMDAGSGEDESPRNSLLGDNQSSDVKLVVEEGENDKLVGEGENDMIKNVGGMDFGDVLKNSLFILPEKANDIQKNSTRPLEGDESASFDNWFAVNTNVSKVIVDQENKEKDGFTKKSLIQKVHLVKRSTKIEKKLPERDEGGVQKRNKDEAKTVECDICGKEFRQTRGLTAHMKMHAKEKSPLLGKSKEKYPQSSAVTPQTSNEQTLVECKDSRIQLFRCDERFKRQSNVSEHSKIQTIKDGATFKCDICGKGFPQKKAFTEHMTKHSLNEGGTPITCEACGQIFSSRSECAKHQQLTCVKHRTKCKVCDKEVQHKQALIEHMLTHGEKPFKCDVCEKRFVQRGKLVIHQRIHTGERPYKCGDCGQAFIEKHFMIVHQRIHTGERPFKCDICGKGFKSRGNVTQHRKIHMNSMQFKCDICGKLFNYKCNLVVHQITHTGEKNYMCSVCGSVYANRASLVIHQRTHTGERPYACDICEKRFRRQDTLSEHKKTHSDRLYMCDVCGKDFTRKTSLYAHFKRIHGGNPSKSFTTSLSSKQIVILDRNELGGHSSNDENAKDKENGQNEGSVWDRGILNEENVLNVEIVLTEGIVQTK